MAPTAPLRLGILASGSGTNFDAIAVAIEEKRLDAEIAVVVCNRPSAPVLAKARARGLDTVEIDHSGFPNRTAFDLAMIDALAAHGVNLVVMAGFDRLVTRELLSRYPDRVLNIHPALLPAFKGLDAQRQAFEYGVRIAGATVHLVDEQMDHGPIIAQAAIPIRSGDDENSVRQRILEEEHVLYPLAIQLFAEGRVEVRGRVVHIRDETHDVLGAPLRSPNQRTSR